MVNRALSGTCEISTGVFTVTNRPPSYVGENGALIVTVAFKNNGSDADLTDLNAEMYLYYPGVSRMTESVNMTISGSSATGRFMSQLTVESGWPLLVIQLVDPSTSELIVACAQPIQVIETRGGEVITTRPPTPSEIVYVGRSPYVDPTTKHWMEWDDGEYVDTGIAATGIDDIQKTGTSGNVDTYTITLSDGSTHTFTVTNGSDIASITKTGTSGLTDTYTVALTDGSTTTFTVTNGRGITNIAKTGTSGNVDTYTITYNDGTTSTFTVTNGNVSSINNKTGDVVLNASDIPNDSNVSGAKASDALNTLKGLTDDALNGTGIPYGVCNTATGTAAKTVTVSPAIASLVEGQVIFVKFTYANTENSNPTLNVNSLGAKSIYKYGTTTPTGGQPFSWAAEQTVMLRYNGTSWGQISPTHQTLATQSAAGLMSAPDKSKLDSLELVGPTLIRVNGNFTLYANCFVYWAKQGNIVVLAGHFKPTVQVPAFNTVMYVDQYRPKDPVIMTLYSSNTSDVAHLFVFTDGNINTGADALVADRDYYVNATWVTQ